MPPRRPLALARAAGFVGLTLALVLLHLAATPLGSPRTRAVRRLWCKGCCLLLGIEVRRQGRPFDEAPTLFVANHVSYLDIVILGATLDATFIGKAEIQGWPLFGHLGRLAGTFFVRRHWRDALIQRNDLAARMRKGESFVLFPEGTSTNGLDVLPFKTSLLSVAEPWVLDRPVAVQAATLAFRRHRCGTPITLANADLYAWHGEGDLLPHLWGAMHGPGLEVDLAFEAPVLSWAVASRKTLGQGLRTAVRARLLGAGAMEDALDHREHGVRVPDAA